jgi:CRP-like cAMP-binding protein
MRPMSRATVAERLKRVPLFWACSGRQRRSIASTGWERTYPERTVLCEQGTRGDEFFVILDGEAEVVRDGKRVRALAGGDHFGELALLHPSITGIPRTATVRTTTPMRCFVLHKLDFRVLLQDGNLAVNMLRSLVGRLADASGNVSI